MLTKRVENDRLYLSFLSFYGVYCRCDYDRNLRFTVNKVFTMYKEVKLEVLHFQQEDIVRTSGESDWYDDNVDDNGWI